MAAHAIFSSSARPALERERLPALASQKKLTPGKRHEESASKTSSSRAPGPHSSVRRPRGVEARAATRSSEAEMEAACGGARCLNVVRFVGTCVRFLFNGREIKLISHSINLFVRHD